METEIEIKRDIDNGMSIRKVAEKYEVSIKKVRNIKDKGKWYVDMLTGESYFTTKTIPINQQHFYVLHHKMIEYEMKLDSNATQKEKIIACKSLIVRIATYLNVDPRTAYRWAKNSKKLMEDNMLTVEIERYILNRYLDSQEDVMKAFYSDSYYIRGHKLHYCYYENSSFTYYINRHCSNFYSKVGVSESDYIKNILGEGVEINPYILRLSAKLGIELSRWVRQKVMEGYSHEECMKCLHSYEKFSKIDYDGVLTPPRVIYYDTRGFLLLKDEHKRKILFQKDNGEIAGTFDINPMEEMVLKLQRIA